MLVEHATHVVGTYVACCQNMRRMLIRFAPMLTQTAPHVDSICLACGIELPRKLAQHASHVDSTCAQLFQKMRRNIFKNWLPRRHGPLLFEALSDPSIYQYIPVEPPASVAQLEARFEQLESRRSPDGSELWLNWAIYFAPGQRYAGLVQATLRPEGEAMLAYELTGVRGEGIATEACAAVSAELAGYYGVASLLAYVDTRNAPSIRLLERLGFSQVETISRADYFKGAWSDEFVYRMKVRQL